LLAVLAGGLLALSLPPFDLGWLGWAAVTPLLLAASGRRVVERLGLGLAAGLCAGAVQVGWHPDTHALHWGYIPFLWLSLLLGVVAAAGAAARPRSDGLRWVFFVATAGVAGEWLTTLTPLPLNLAISQYRALPLIQLAAFTGIWGVSFLVWWANAALADAILSRRPAAPHPSSSSPTLPLSHSSPIALGAALLLAALLFGTLRLRALQPGPSLRVAAIQDHTGAETATLIAPSAGEEGDRDAMTRAAVGQGAQLVVWSEGCLGAAFAPGARLNPTADLARELKAHLVVGYSEPAEPRPFNCAAIVAPDGRVLGIHRKIHLFFGERQAVQPGSDARAWDTTLGRLGMEICFDSCYTSVTRRLVASGAQLVAMPNYDPPTPRGVMHRLHGALLPFRAVENAVPFVRADPNGLSQVIDRTGGIRAQAPLFSAAALVGPVPLGDGRGTLFTRLGDCFAYLCLLAAAAGWLILRRTRS
jgi:apolipoprotein N-acyltransferase